MRVAGTGLLGTMLATLLATPLYAAPITRVFEITATTFFTLPLVPAPVNPVKVTFTLTWDPDTDLIGPRARGLFLDSINITLDDAFEYGWDRLNGGGALILGNNIDYIPSLGSFAYRLKPGANTIGLIIKDAATSQPILTSLDYSQAGFDSSWSAVHLQIGYNQIQTIDVPEPASIFLAVFGLGMAGLVKRRKSI